MIQVAAYCRVSTDREDQSNSFRAQQRFFREYIQSQPGWMLHEIYADEGITGTSTKKRTQFNRMIADAYEGRFQMIVTKEVSRFSRNILDTISYTRQLKAMGIGVIFVNDRINTLEPEAEMLLSFLASLAQEESRRTSSRVVWGQTRQMERGVVFGRSLLGYDVKKGILQINPVGAELVRLIFHKYALEQVSTGEIARYLTETGFQTQGGKNRWSSHAVVKILKNEKYAGDLIQKKTYTPDYLTHEKRTNRGQVPMIVIRNHHEPIVSRELWNLAQSRLQRNNKHSEEPGCHSNRYAFSGKIRCGECGSIFVGRFQYRKDGTKIRRWSCAAAVREGTRGCSVGKLVRDDDAVHMLKTALRSLPVDREAIIRNVADLALKALAEGEQATAENQRQLAAALDHLQEKKEAVLDSYFSGEITREEMQVMNRKYEAQREDLLRRQQEAEQRKKAHEDSAVLRSSLEARIARILNLETESQAFYKSLVESITVFQDRHLELRLQELPQVFLFWG